MNNPADNEFSPCSFSVHVFELTRKWKNSKKRGRFVYGRSENFRRFLNLIPVIILLTNDSNMKIDSKQLEGTLYSGPLKLGPCPECDEDWSRLYDFYAELILKFITNKGHSHELAQDVLQETMLCLWKIQQKRNGHADEKLYCHQIKAKIFTIAYSRFIDLIRRNFRYVELSSQKQDQLFTESKVNWDREFEEKVKNQVITKLKSELDGLEYTVFKMTILKFGKTREVARTLNLKPRQVSDIKYKLNRLIEKRSKELRRQYGP